MGIAFLHIREKTNPAMYFANFANFVHFFTFFAKTTQRNYYQKNEMEQENHF